MSWWDHASLTEREKFRRFLDSGWDSDNAASFHHHYGWWPGVDRFPSIETMEPSWCVL